MKTLASPRDTEEILRRLRRLRPDSQRRWGRMSAHQAVCHMADTFLMDTPDKRVSPVRGIQNRTVVKWIALYAPVRWPAGRIRTRPEVDQEIGGTRPREFDEDVTALERLVEIAATAPGFFWGRRHPIFGRCSEAAWRRWGYLHMDHHLRQFGE